MKSQLGHLRLLNKAKPTERAAVLENADRELLMAICEIALNVLCGNVKLTKPLKSALCKHRHTMRQLADERLPLAKKRKLLIQKGGFLPALIAPALSVLTSLLL
jgi:hypothetical protein